MLCYQVIQTLSGCKFSISYCSSQGVLHITQASSRDVPELGELARNKHRMHTWESQGTVLRQEGYSPLLNGVCEPCISGTLEKTCSERGFEGRSLQSGCLVLVSTYFGGQ